jgi:hypothetical protein
MRGEAVEVCVLPARGAATTSSASRSPSTPRASAGSDLHPPLFDKDVRTVNEHIHNIYSEGECAAEATIRKFRIVQTEGARQVEREVDAYNLDVILSVGYRIRSPRGTQFRCWATTVLREYLAKGFAMDDVRLKQAEQWDYFDEWLARIRDIRASEKRFYQ